VGGACQPFLVFDGRQPKVNGLYSLSVDDPQVFLVSWCSGSPLLMVDVGGAAVTPLAPDDGPSTCGAGVFADANAVFYGSFAFNANPQVSTVISVPRTGGSPKTLASNVAGTTLIVADDQYVYYWIDSVTVPNLYRVSRDGGASMLIPGLTDAVRSVAVDATYLYASTTGGQVLQIDKQTFVSKDIVQSPNGTAPQPHHVAVNATNVFWSDDVTAGLYTVPIGGGNLTILLEQSSPVVDLAADADWAYLATDDGVIHAYDQKGTVQRALATDQKPVTGFGIDAKFVYWGHVTPDLTQLWKVAK
jgi:hypothetical protein